MFRLLDQMRKLPAIWVSGPAGSGKTTLVNTYLEARRIPLLTPEYLQDIEKAIDLYKGPFLADEMDQSWIISTRERCRSRFIRNLTWLGHYGQDRKDWGKALESFQRGLEIDDVAEDLYQEMMICYRELGRRAEALSVYQRCRKMLSTILGIAPSSKTEAIFESLIPGGNK